jgi:phosphoesterase RecJ-like protein
MALKEVVEQIKKNRSFLITSHLNLEGDALGSELAFRALLIYLGKKAMIINKDAVPNEYKLLPGIENIKRIKNKQSISFDAFVVLDCSDLGRCKEVAKLAGRDKVIINIDHHISNNNFGDINWVEPKSSSASEMIYKLFKKMRIPLDRDKALCMYVGILTDTGSFRYPNTTSDSLAIAADLLHYDLEVSKIYKNIYENISFTDIELLTKILSTMRFYMQGKIVWFKIKRNLIKNKKVSIDLAEHVLNFGRLAEETEVVVLFKENLDANNQIRVNLRSKNIDVNRIAKIFGGGGHRNASGCTLVGPIESVQRQVIEKIKEQL